MSGPGGAHPDGAMAKVNRDLSQIAHVSDLKLGGERNAPMPQVIRIKDPQPTKTPARANIGKRAKHNPKVKTPLKNPELIGKGGKGIPQTKPPQGKTSQVGKTQTPPAKSASRIPMANQTQAKNVKPMQIKSKAKSVDKER